MAVMTADYLRVGRLIRKPIVRALADLGASYVEERDLLGSTLHNLRIETSDERLLAFVAQMRRLGALPKEGEKPCR